MDVKKCSRCKEVKPISEFYKYNLRENGYQRYCKNCNAKSSAIWQRNNVGKVKEKDARYYKNNRDKILERNKKWREDNSERNKERVRKWRESNPERVGEHCRKWRESNPKKARESVKKSHKKRNLIFQNRLNNNIRRFIWLSLKGNKNGNHWENLVGYTLQDLIIHLENQFQYDMSWVNYGRWHIDHIIPVSLWKFSSYNDSEFKQCWALANLQPLWAKENHSKGNRVCKR